MSPLPWNPGRQLAADARAELERRRRRGHRLVMLGALDGERAVYVTHGDAGYEPLLAAGPLLPDAAALFPAAAAYQVEAQELWGLSFEGARVDRTVRGVFRRQDRGAAGSAQASPFEAPALPLPEPPYSGDAIHRIPYGPVRDASVESLLHRFHYLGERIVELEQHLGYKHRAAEDRMTRSTVETLPLYAERVSGVSGVAFALAACQAVEAASGIEVPARAQGVRVILGELERAYNHFRDISRLAASTTLRVGAAHGQALQEWTQRIAAGLTGHRFMRGMVAVGGVRHDLDVSGLGREASRLEVDARAYFDVLEGTELFLDRLETTGRLAPGKAGAWGAVGPVGRASGQAIDVRRDTPYGAYRGLDFGVPVETAGDALARFRVRCGEVLASLYLVREMAEALPPGGLRAPPPGAFPENALCLGASEGARGEVVAMLATDQHGALSRVMLRGGSRHNWPLFPDTVNDSFLMDYAINEASWGLIAASHDR